MAKKEIPEDEGPSQEWLASYADAMTLLLAFFIMMFAFALIDEGKYFDFKVGVMAALGVPDPLTDNTDSILAKGTGITPEIGMTPLRPSEEQQLALEALEEELKSTGTVTAENVEDLKEYLDRRFALAGVSEDVTVGIDERGVYVRFPGKVLFESGEAELDEDGLLLLAVAADALSAIENPIEVEGHTDSQPTAASRWPSNWELSSARAARVVRWMIQPGNMDPGQLASVGRADTNPVGNNATAEGRRENRRVEIVTRVPELLTDSLPDADIEASVRGSVDGSGTADDAPDEITLDDVATIDPIGDPIGIGGALPIAEPDIGPEIDGTDADGAETDLSEGTATDGTETGGTDADGADTDDGGG